MATVATPACFTISLRTCSLWASRLRLFGSARMLESTTRYAARQMMSARKQNGKAAPWNNYSGVPLFPRSSQEAAMNGIIYLIGLIVVILAILSFFGLR